MIVSSERKMRCLTSSKLETGKDDQGDEELFVALSDQIRAGDYLQKASEQVLERWGRT